MSRFVIISFAVMAVAFYELSGGADFKPRTRSVDLPEVTRISQVAPAPKPASENVTLPTTIRAEPVTKAKANVTSLAVPDGGVLKNAAASGDINAATDDAENSAGVQLVSLAQSAALFANPLALGSPAPVAAAEQTIPRAPDLRQVIGTRVNMRMGPGTEYDVIDRLPMGMQVEVLDSSGIGWLQLRTVSGQQIGWISSSLVSKPQN